MHSNTKIKTRFIGVSRWIQRGSTNREHCFLSLIVKTESHLQVWVQPKCGLVVCRAIHVCTFISQLWFSNTLSEYWSRPRDRRINPRPSALPGLSKSCRGPNNICTLNDTLCDKSNKFVLIVLFTAKPENREHFYYFRTKHMQH